MARMLESVRIMAQLGQARNSCFLSNSFFLHIGRTFGRAAMIYRRECLSNLAGKPQARPVPLFRSPLPWFSLFCMRRRPKPARRTTDARLLATLPAWTGGPKSPSPKTPIPHPAWRCLLLASHSLHSPTRPPRLPTGCTTKVDIIIS